MITSKKYKLFKEYAKKIVIEEHGKVGWYIFVADAILIKAFIVLGVWLYYRG